MKGKVQKTLDCKHCQSRASKEQILTNENKNYILTQSLQKNAFNTLHPSSSDTIIIKFHTNNRCIDRKLN